MDKYNRDRNNNTYLNLASYIFKDFELNNSFA